MLQVYKEELEAELASLITAQEKFPTEYKERRILELRKRLNLDPVVEEKSE